MRLLIRNVIVLTSGITIAHAAEVRGFVFDEGGFPLKGASVVVRSLTSAVPAVEAKALTKGDGSFLVAEVPFGEYSLEASLEGFISVRLQPIRVGYLAYRRDFRLPLASGNEGGVYSMAEFVGTIVFENRRVPWASVCLSAGEKRTCTATNSLGEYHIKVVPDFYVATISIGERVLWRENLGFIRLGEYRDKLKPQ